MRIGFVGTGAISAAMVTGILSPEPVAREIVLSPRNAEIAAGLARRFAAVSVAADNQSAVDASDMVVLAVRPQIAEDVVRELRFRQGQAIVSVMAATDRETLLGWIGTDVSLTQAIPLPFVAERQGVTAIYPPNPEVAALFAVLGTAVECETKEEYDLLAAASALMATYFGLLDRSVGWLGDKGLPAAKARAYLAPLFSSLAQTAVASQSTPLDELREEFSTKGGLNEQVFQDFDSKGGTKALREALDRVLARIKG